MIDRLKDMIITGSENVYSVEVEAVLTEHAAVAESAVFGIPDPRWGEAVPAVVTLVSGSEVSTQQLIKHCRTLIAGSKVPRSIEISDEPLPESAAGKRLKKTLRELAASRLSGAVCSGAAAPLARRAARPPAARRRQPRSDRWR